MKESLQQTLAQRMQQRLSPQQVRLVRMLEMSEPEMEEEVRRELDDNPALAEADSQDQHGDEGEGDYHESAEEMQRADYRDDDDIPYYRQNVSNYSADDNHYEPTAIASSETLAESLERQLSELPLSDRQSKLGRYIIGNLDDNGYLTRTPAELEDDLALNAGIEVSPGELREVTDLIRSLDPAGVGAVDLRDSLLLQLKRRDEGEPGVKLATEIVRDYFDLFSMRHFDRLESLLKVDREELRRADEVIRSLDPKPGSRVGGSDA
ncbi:MAG: RNA polymerase sigma-54 factor, partial [Duncaniella sp.]|nr:RNA polymerase sigma-54 factor [Duncaniella sp.]